MYNLGNEKQEATQSARHTLRLLGEDTARVIVVDSTTSQAQPDDGVLPASRLGRTGAYESAGRRGTGCDSRRAGERSSSGTEHCVRIERSSKKVLRGSGKSKRGRSWMWIIRPEDCARSASHVPPGLIIISSLRTLSRTPTLSFRSDLDSSLSMEWDPSRFFRVSGSPSPYALLVLNQPINENAFGVLSQYGEYYTWKSIGQSIC